MRTRPLPRLFLALAAAAVAPAAGRADPIVFTNQHVDIDLRFEGGRLEIGWHDETNDVEYAAGEALVFVGPNAVVPRPAGGQFNFLGVGPGQPVWVLPQIADPGLVFLGIGSEEVDPADFTGDLTVEVLGVRGPGAFSAWGTDAFGNPQVLFAGAAGFPQSFARPAGTHQHFNFALTAPGRYELDLRVSGRLAATGQVISSDVTALEFRVEGAAAVPAPASALVLAAALAPILARRRKKPV